MSSRRLVDTGGAGFLGSHLCDALLSGGDEVVAIDNLSTVTEFPGASVTEFPHPACSQSMVSPGCWFDEEMS